MQSVYKVIVLLIKCFSHCYNNILVHLGISKSSISTMPTQLFEASIITDTSKTHLRSCSMGESKHKKNAENSISPIALRYNDSCNVHIHYEHWLNTFRLNAKSNIEHGLWRLAQTMQSAKLRSCQDGGRLRLTNIPSPPCRVALTAAIIFSWVAIVGILSTT